MAEKGNGRCGCGQPEYEQTSGGGEIVAVDLERAGKSMTVPVLVRYFYTENGHGYYKPGPMQST